MADPTIQTFWWLIQKIMFVSINFINIPVSKFQLPSSKSFRLCLSTHARVQPRLIFDNFDDLINCRHSRRYLSNLHTKRRNWGSPRRSMGRKIIVALAYSDFFASLGIFVRSAMWTLMKEIMPFDDDSASVMFCSITSAFIQMFYTSTWLWTLIYAYNMRKSLMNQTTREKDFHFIVWSISIIFTAIGTSSLYYPDAEWVDPNTFCQSKINVDSF